MLRHASRAVSRALPPLVVDAGRPVFRNIRGVSTSSASLTKPKQGSEEDTGAAARRTAAEEDAASTVRAWSSPLFSHVDLEVDDGRVIPRWKNLAFITGVVLVFGFVGRFAVTNERKKSASKQREVDARETRARVAIESGILQDHKRRNFAGADDVDPFEGMSPEEIEKLAKP